MKEITVSLYTFAELSEKAKKTALHEHRYHNIATGWCQPELNLFSELAESVGVRVDMDNIRFTGTPFGQRGCGFESDGELITMLDNISANQWKEIAPDLELTPCPCSPHLIKLIRNGSIEVDVSTGINPRPYSLSHVIDFRTDRYNETFKNIDSELEALKAWIMQTLESLNAYLHSRIRKAYLYQTSDEQVAAYLIRNNYWFTADGNADNWIQTIAQKYIQ